MLLSGLTAATGYVFTVTARDAAGNESRPSAPLTVTTPAGADLALGKAVTVSSYSDPNTPDLAVDGDLSTRWAQGLGLSDPSWIQVDLGAQYDVTGAITTFEKSSGYRYRTEVSPDEAHWAPLDDHTGAATTGATQYDTASSTVDGSSMSPTSAWRWATGASNSTPGATLAGTRPSASLCARTWAPMCR